MTGFGHTSGNLQPLEHAFGERLVQGISLSRYTSSRLGGPADLLLEVASVSELIEVSTICWAHKFPFVLLGAGSNVLISDAGIRGLVVINRANDFSVDQGAFPPSAWAESGANFGVLARRVSSLGLTGLEWAVGIPGTVGGAVVGNAGAHGYDMNFCLDLAEILHHSYTEQASAPLREEWPVESLNYSYRDSILKHMSDNVIVLAAQFNLEASTSQITRAKIDEFTTYRRQTQPPGASMGSVFKNPKGDYAGRLIEAAGLKGTRIGNAQISSLHANFISNLGQAASADMYALIQIAHQKVLDKFGVDLELEIEILGEW